MRLRYLRGDSISQEKIVEHAQLLKKTFLDLGKGFEVLSAHLGSHR